MSDDDEAYFKAIEAQFIALQGRGYAISGRDVGRVLAWRAQGVPLRLVVGQLQQSFSERRNPVADRPASLGMVARDVEAAMRRRAERQVPASVSEPSPSERGQRIALIESTLVGVGQRADPRARPALREAWRRLRELADQDVSPWRVADELDALIGAALAKLLDERARAELEAAIDARVNPHMDAEARAEKVAFELARALRERFAVPELLGVLLDAR